MSGRLGAVAVRIDGHSTHPPSCSRAERCELCRQTAVLQLNIIKPCMDEPPATTARTGFGWRVSPLAQVSLHGSSSATRLIFVKSLLISKYARDSRKALANFLYAAYKPAYKPVQFIIVDLLSVHRACHFLF
mgnify:CR=1 FL=1